jgi:hypothetical protein
MTKPASTTATRPWIPPVTRPWIPAIASIGLFGVAFAMRLEQHHAALLYPDGYQYLLMARGISEHFGLTTVLGPGGEVFVPNADAAAKPLFPLLVAVAHSFGAGWLSAATVVTSLASASVVVLVFLLTTRLAGAPFAGAAAAVVLLASPSLAFWSGFSGPDPLAQALGLGAALAFVDRRPRVGGALLALAVATRPELVVVGVCAFVVSLPEASRRRASIEGAIAFVPTLAFVLLALRPPFAPPDKGLLCTFGLLVLFALALAFAPVDVLAIGALGTLVVAAVVFSAPASGLLELWWDDWPLIGAAVVGLAITACNPDRRGPAFGIFAAAVALGAVYWVKNPGLERYFAMLLPIAAVLVGVGAAELVRRRRWSVPLVAAAVVALAAVGSVRPSGGPYDQDVFSATAQKLEPLLSSTAPLVTAAPDAYGFWLPEQPVRTMRPGARGLVLLDPAQRSYAPHLTADGKIVARVDTELAFSRPNGEIDLGRAVLVAGRVARRGGRLMASPHPSRERSTADSRYGV